MLCVKIIKQNYFIISFSVLKKSVKQTQMEAVAAGEAYVPQANAEDEEPALNEVAPPAGEPPDVNAGPPVLNKAAPPLGEPPEAKAGDVKELENAVGEVNAGVNNEIEDEPDDKQFVFSRELKGVHDPLRPGDRFSFANWTPSCTIPSNNHR